MQSIRTTTTKVRIAMHDLIDTLTTVSARVGIFRPNRLSNLISDVTFNILHVDKIRAVRFQKILSSNRLSNFFAVLFWCDPRLISCCTKAT